MQGMTALHIALVVGSGSVAEALIKHIPGLKPDAESREVGALLGICHGPRPIQVSSRYCGVWVGSHLKIMMHHVMPSSHSS